MPNMFRWLALISAIVLIISLTMGIVSPRPNPEPQQQQTTVRSQTGKIGEVNNKTLWNVLFPDTNSLYTLFLVIFTAVLAFVGAVQLQFLNRAEQISANTAQTAKDSAESAKKSAEIAERALIAGQRAFISVVFEPYASKNIETDRITAWNFTPVWQNSGNTPTKEMHNHINIRIFDGPLPRDWDFPDSWPANTPVADRRPTPLGAPPKGTVRGQSVGISVDQMRDIVSGSKQLYMWGWAIYNDVFPNTVQHVTRFAVQIVAGGDPTDKDKMSFGFQLVGRYNCSDEECDRQGYPGSWTPREPNE
jgi:hypothetical protein